MEITAKNYRISDGVTPQELFLNGFRDGGKWIDDSVAYFYSVTIRCEDGDDVTHFYITIDIGVPEKMDDFDPGRHICISVESAQWGRSDANSEILYCLTPTPGRVYNDSDVTDIDNDVKYEWICACAYNHLKEIFGSEFPLTEIEQERADRNETENSCT